MEIGRIEATKFGYRYKLLTFENKNYYVDLDGNFLFPLFPFLIFFMPIKAYKIEELQNVWISDGFSVSTMFISGMGLILGRTVIRLGKYFTIYLENPTKLLLLLSVVLLVLIIRYALKKRNQKNISDGEEIEIRIKPYSICRQIFVLFFLCCIYGALALIIYFLWIEMDIPFLILGSVVLYILTCVNMLLVKSGEYEVKFLGDD